jgi:hypothetical protein
MTAYYDKNPSPARKWVLPQILFSCKPFHTAGKIPAPGSWVYFLPETRLHARAPYYSAL